MIWPGLCLIFHRSGLITPPTMTYASIQRLGHDLTNALDKDNALIMLDRDKE